MKYILIITFGLGINFFAYGTGQIPDFLIYENDTLEIFSNPLEQYLDANEDAELIDFVGCGSTACWRGYTAFWRLENDTLYLEKITSCHKSCGLDINDADLKKMFGTDNVVADWFTGNITAPRGELIYYVHMGYGSLYEKEEVFIFENGRLINQKLYQNYKDTKKGISRKNIDSISNHFYKELINTKWKEKFDCEDEFLIIINGKGKVEKIRANWTEEEINEFYSEKGYSYCIKKLLKEFKDLKFDELSKQGKPISQDILIELSFNDDGIVENWNE